MQKNELCDKVKRRAKLDKVADEHILILLCSLLGWGTYLLEWNLFQHLSSTLYCSSYTELKRGWQMLDNVKINNIITWKSTQLNNIIHFIIRDDKISCKFGPKKFHFLVNLFWIGIILHNSILVLLREQRHSPLLIGQNMSFLLFAKD